MKKEPAGRGGRVDLIGVRIPVKMNTDSGGM